MGDSSYALRYLPLYKAIITNDWDTAERILDQDPEADTTVITNWGSTTLHVAVGTNTNRSHCFVEKLVNRIAAKDKMKLRTPESATYNALHYAAQVGNTKAAKALVEKDPGMALIANQYGCTAVKLAAMYGQKETLEYLLGVTPNEIGEDGITSPYSGMAGGDLITLTITAKFYDVAMNLINKYPNLVTEKDRHGVTALDNLATQHMDFPSGRSWWFWKNLIYYWTPIITSTCFADIDSREKSENRKPSSLWRKIRWFKSLLPASFKRVCFRFYILIWRIAQYLVPFLRNIHDTKMKHKQMDQLMKAIITTVLSVGDHSVAWDVLGTAMSTAARLGTHELIEECLKQYPCLLWFYVDGMHLFLASIIYRQVKVYNLFYQMTGFVVLAATNIIGGDNALHLAGRKPFPYRLNTVTGAALQMQRELQWFKEVERFVMPSFKGAMNVEKKTPRMVFTDEHKDLLEKGEKWMKDTASSSTLVAALIVTVAFAAMFTAPGGNKDDGTPYFLRDSTFLLFAISDSIALFSSVTSVLMFLATLTSRYAEDDFLYALPKRITIGLLSLFISIAAIMVTFCAALALVLRERLVWIAIPVGFIACVPVIFFVLLQFPLLVELVLSTYGPSIFRKQNDLILH